MSIISLSGRQPTNLGINGARLAPCPPSPNCVCSDETDARHGLAPLRLAVPAAEAWAVAKQAVLSLPRTRIVAEHGDYIHAECASAMLGFVDDLEMHLRAHDGIIAVRCASRLGYSDFGVNRKRVEGIRAVLVARGAVR